MAESLEERRARFEFEVLVAYTVEAIHRRMGNRNPDGTPDKHFIQQVTEAKAMAEDAGKAVFGAR